MSTRTDLDECLQERLLTVEDELIGASDGDPKAIKSFLDRMGEVQRMATRAIAENSLTARTAALIRSVASTGAALVRLASEVRTAGTVIEKKRQSRLRDAMAKLSLESDVQNEQSDPTPSPEPETNDKSEPEMCPPALAKTRTRRSHDVPSLPPHIQRCYEWLLQNLHSPYPPATFRSRLSKDTGVSQKAICDWFTNARRKIGWTKISERHFHKDRALTVDCARIVLLGENGKNTVCGELRDAFLAMKDTAEKLFEDVLGPSDVARHLDDLVKKHASPSHQISLDDSGMLSNGQTKETISQPMSKKVLGKRRAMSDNSASTTVSESSSERRQIKRLRTAASTTDPSPSAIPSKDPVPSISAKTERSSSKRRRADSSEYRPAKRCRSLSGSTDSSPDGVLLELYDGESSTPLGTTSDSTASSPAASLLTVSDESIGTPSPSASDDLFASSWLNTDSLSSSDIFSLKDLVDLPDIPTFTWDGADIPPPSFEPIPLSADFSISDFEGLLNSDASWLSTLESNLFSEPRSDALVPDLTDILQLDSATTPSPDFFEEFFRSNNGLCIDETERREGEL